MVGDQLAVVDIQRMPVALRGEFLPSQCQLVNDKRLRGDVQVIVAGIIPAADIDRDGLTRFDGSSSGLISDKGIRADRNVSMI